MAYYVLIQQSCRNSEPRGIQIGEKRVPMFRWSRATDMQARWIVLAISFNDRKSARGKEEKRKREKGGVGLSILA